jgi:very-short-patch-repair endonuclease
LHHSLSFVSFGGIHDLEYRKTPDRIRQRALNTGYSVYRVKNKEVESSRFDVARRVVDRYYQIMEVEGEQKIASRKIKKTYDL